MDIALQVFTCLIDSLLRNYPFLSFGTSFVYETIDLFHDYFRVSWRRFIILILKRNYLAGIEGIK